MKYFLFDQNNSGGYFDIDNYVCGYVLIEAENSIVANEIAENIGIYFDGVSKGEDCSCCGDRWRKVDEEEGTDNPTIYGDDIYTSGRRCYVYRNYGENKEIIGFDNN